MKLGGWVIMLTTLLIILSLVGMNNTTGDTILDTVGINITNGNLYSMDVESSSIWQTLFSEDEITIGGASFSKGILVTLLGGAIIVGLFSKGYDPSLVILPLVIFIAGLFISSFYSIVMMVNVEGIWWMTSIITVIFGGLVVGFIFACVDYFAGR